MSAIEWVVVCCFLVTILGAVSLNFAVEALVVLHELLFLGFRVLCSSATGGVNVHVVSSLRGRVVSRPGWFSMIWIAAVWIDSKDLIQGLPSAAVVLFSGLPFDVLVVGFLFPLFELPRVIGSWVVVGGSDNDLDKCPFEVVL